MGALTSMRFWMAAPLIVACAGCVTTSMENEFAEVDAAVKERMGYDVAWAGVTAEQDDVTAYVQQVLNEELTADGAVQVALLNNRQLQATYAEMGIQVGEFIQAGLLPNPVVDVAARLRNGNRIIEGAVTQNFLEMLLIPLRRRLEGAQLAAAQRQVEAEIIDLAAETRMAFWEYVAARHHHALAMDLLAADAAGYRMAWQLRSAGNIRQLELLREQERMERAKLEVAEAEMSVLEQRERLNALMGLWGQGRLWETAERLPAVPELELDLENIEARAIDASLDLTISLYDLVASAQRLGIRRITSVVPELSLGVDAERELETDYDLVKREFVSETEYELEEHTSEVWWAGPTVSVEVPLFDQGQGRRAAARMEIRRQWEQVTDLATSIRAAARLAAYRLQYARARAQFYNEVMVPVRHRIVLRSHLQYNAMFEGIFDLLDEKSQELNTSRDYIEALKMYWVARTQAEQLLMGRLYDTKSDRMHEGGQGGGQMGMQRPGNGTPDGERQEEGGH